MAYTINRYGAASAAFLGYGTWSAWANSGPLWWRFGLIQGCYAFASTLALYHFVRLLERQLGSMPHAGIVVWIISSLVAAAIPASLQFLAGSHAILLAITPGAITSSVYAYAVIQGLVEPRSKQLQARQ
jgi:hypothetical protein